MINLQDLMSFYKWNSTHVDMKKCEELKNEGLLNIKKHILHPIYLLNYTAKTQYCQQWCKELIHARGLVVAEDGEILARPLPKFLTIVKLMVLKIYMIKTMNFTKSWMGV